MEGEEEKEAESLEIEALTLAFSTVPSTKSKTPLVE